MTKPSSPGQIFNAKNSAVLTLVPNQRVFGLELAGEFEAPDDRQVISAPSLSVFSAWVEQVSTRIDLLAGQPIAASIDQLRLNQLWQKTVDKDPGWNSAFQSHTQARFARNAERLTRHWYFGEDLPWLHPQFMHWRSSVRSELQNQRFNTAEDWLERLIVQLKSPGDLPISLPDEIGLRGFLEMTKLEKALITELHKRGITFSLDEDSQNLPASDRIIHPCDSLIDELRTTACWAKRCVDQGHKRIAVVVQGLDNLAQQLVPVFDRELHGQNALQIQYSGESLFHLPNHCRLSDHAIIDDALLLLRITAKGKTVRLPFPDISQLLLSPHIGGWDKEQAGRSHLEITLRKQDVFYRTLTDLKQGLSGQETKARLPILYELLSSVDKQVEGSDISQIFLDQLKNWGWPGPLAHGLLTSKRVQKFSGLLERLRLTSPGSPRQALSLLTQWCSDTRLTERGGPLSPVQILSPEDAAGQRFEAAWIMNVHDGNWPGQPISNPYLPPGAAQHIPRASAEGELEFTRKLQSRLDSLAPEPCFSWSNSGGDVPRLPSALVFDKDWGEQIDKPDPVAKLPAWSWLIKPEKNAGKKLDGYFNHPWLITMDDEWGPRMHHEEGSGIPGASSMFTDQSSCPLMAFLKHRQKVQFPPMPGPLAGYAFRGKLLHEALYQLYSAHVGEGSTPQHPQVVASVNAALRQQQANKKLAPTAYRAEQKRLERLLHQWLDFERNRKSTSVQSLEENLNVNIDGFELDLRMDRIDQMPDGRQLIIDYKSGSVNAGAWVGERISEPQLPLYAVLLDQRKPGSVGGLSLASVRAGDCGMHGVVDDSDIAVGKLYHTKNRRSSFGRHFAGWEELFSHWQSVIEDLKQEIVGGYAANIVYHKDGLKYSGLDCVLRRSEGEAWLAAWGAAEGVNDD